MARRKRKPRDVRENHGKYSSDSAPSKRSSASASTESKDSATSAHESRSGTQASNDANPQIPENDGRRVGSAINDPEWYAKDAQLVIDAASLPFSEPVGDEIKLITPGELIETNGVTPTVVAASTQNGEAVPGVCTLYTKSTFGNSKYAQDPANVAANALYSHVRYVNSGRKNYDPADLFMYVSSMADVYSYVMWMERIYAKAYIYSQKNKYIGDALLRSEHLDPQSLKANLANFRYWLNTYINKISSYAVPAEISYYQRRAWVYAHIYIENPDGNIKDQLYQFAPDGFFRFALDTAGLGMLEYKTLSSIIGRTVSMANPITVPELQQIGDWLIQNITGDEDFGLMSGDILKAFNGNIIGIPSLPEVVDIIPVYSEYVLLQMRNASVVHVSRDSIRPCHYADLDNGVNAYTGNVYQNSDGNIWAVEGVISDGSATRDCIAAGMRKILTVNTPTPTPIDVMEVSRLMVGGYGVLALTGMDPTIKISCGADIVVDSKIYYFGYDANQVWGLQESNWASIVYSSTEYSSWALGFLRRNKFKYAPVIYKYDIDTGVTPNEVSSITCESDVNNYTIVDWRVCARLHEVALLSMLWVPGVAKVVNVG